MEMPVLPNDPETATMTKPIRTAAFLFIPALLGALVLALAGPACAQGPRIKMLFPPGVRRGATGTITLSGENLKPGSRVLVSGEGVTATAAAEGGGTSLAGEVQGPPDANPHPHRPGVLGPHCASDAARVPMCTLP